MDDISNHRRWMYNRLMPGRGLHEAFIDGVDEFVNFATAQSEYQNNEVIRCPCKKCRNLYHLKPEDVKVHLYKKGFEPNYWVWICHGEELPQQSGEATINDSRGNAQDAELNQYESMLCDIAGPSFNPNIDEVEGDIPHESSKKFYDLLESARQPLWSGSNEETELSYTLKIMDIKSTFNIPQLAMDAILQLHNRAFGPNRVPLTYYQSQKMIGKLGLGYDKIDCCVNGCMLYYKDDVELVSCKVCGEARYKTDRHTRSHLKKVSRKKMHYLPLIPRLQRLYASPNSAKHMRWHFENRREPNVMCHPSDGEAWKNFDTIYPEFAAEPRNVRLGLCADGFSPFGMNAKTYSCWPVIVVPYNLPPSMCMTMPYMFLSCVIPGKSNPKAKIDVYLQPLIDELKLLWDTGVVTYDISLKQNFLMKAALMWTINDFPAYGMLSGWQTAGKLACPYCMHNSKAFYLKNSRKNSWFDCHRQFLHLNHQFRRNREGFLKKMIEKSRIPQVHTGDELFERVSTFPKITEGVITRQIGYGHTHNWTKKSIFWDLVYWKDHLLRHNLDVMHIEKNVFDNVFHTVMNVKGTNKNKDSVKSRLDVHEYCNRPQLHLVEHNGKVFKPKANYTLERDEQRVVCEWVQNLKLPDGFASNVANCVDLNENKLCGLKSHDCHIFMECLMPIAFSLLPHTCWNVIAELSIFFRHLCSATLFVNKFTYRMKQD
ncbi:PREDICTED: uncharacterized protein LOC109147764 [Ipomoea nil]|uniref:uncharacterized protein LOC109147764 n=1 Tax=Ipomoea nil TaxID=35883 RepID=UPI000900BD47|nr:PREDICTED: uncharacterized protein LOC109147764 [Ipomoea nil]